MPYAGLIVIDITGGINRNLPRCPVTVTDFVGLVEPGVRARVIRGGERIGEVEVEKVQRQQQEAKEVFEGEMCGLSLKIQKKLLIEEGDSLEFFKRELVKRKLS